VSRGLVAHKLTGRIDLATDSVVAEYPDPLASNNLIAELKLWVSGAIVTPPSSR
jgi:hypothetical protein